MRVPSTPTSPSWMLVRSLVRPTLGIRAPLSSLSNQLRNMRIIPVPVREDNYAYILMSTPTQSGVRPEAVFVDPFDVAKVRQAAHGAGLSFRHCRLHYNARSLRPCRWQRNLCEGVPQPSHLRRLAQD